MNPEQLSFCIDSNRPVANIPLYFNQTKPKSVELLRIDFMNLDFDSDSEFDEYFE